MRQLWGVQGLCLAAIVTATALPADAGARTVLPNAGTVTLNVSAVARGRLDGVDVRVSGKRSRVTGGSWSFDRLADDGGGTLRLKGTLKFRRGRLKVDVRDFQFALARNSGSGRFADGHLSARVGKSRFRVGSLITRRYRSTPGRFEGLSVVFSPAFVGALNRLLQARAFDTHDTFGSFVGRAITQNITFTGGRASVAFSDETRAAFGRMGASITPLDGATGDGSLANPFVFPITGRRLDVVSLKGGITFGGGLRFTAPAGQTFGGAPSLDLAAAEIGVLDDAYLVRSPSLDFLSAFADGDTSQDLTSRRYRHTGLAVQFTRPVADRIAPALGMTPAELIQLPKGQLDIDGTLR